MGITAMSLLGYTLAIAIGLSLGLLGGGGSVLALPVLVYVMGINPKTAIVMTLVIVGTVSLLGALPHAQRGNINGKITLLFGFATTIGSFLGARIATLPVVSSTFQLTLFAIAMITAAMFMILRTKELTSLPENKDCTSRKSRWLWLVAEGIGVGILTGLVGVGGGFAIVPALVLLGDVPIRAAIGSSLLIISANAAAGLMGYWGYISLDWQLTITFTFLAGCGTVIGGYLGQYIPVKHLQKWFGYFLLMVAAFVLVQNQLGWQSPKKSAVLALTEYGRKG